MIFKTHLMAAILVLFLFLPKVNNKFIFVFVFLFASFLPDIDTPFSKYGKNKSFRFMQFFVKHRTFFHSFTFAFLISGLISLFFPKIAFAFFLGYSLHLFLDSFTVQGIMPFWPIKDKIKWKVKTGGFLEGILFKILVVFNILLIVLYLINL